MKKYLLSTLFLLVCLLSNGQDNVDSLVAIGIQYHENGAYDLAIEKYEEALEVSPKSPLANYEIALTYMYSQQYEKALEHCDVVLEQKEEYILETYITKGSCLDYLGDTKASVKLFKKAVKKFGDHYLLYYNLGYDYYKMREDEKAEEALISAINLSPGHASSHLLLGFLKADQQKKTQSLLCLHYFLFLEPDSDRSVAAYDLLMEQFGGNVTSDDKEITIYIDESDKNSPFSAADLMISMLEASKNLEENEGKTDEEMFIENTASFFTVLGELKKDKNKGLWWDFYTPLFYAISQSDYMDAYCYYISMGGNQNAGGWVQDNQDKMKAFIKWLEDPAE
ncbi:tetratricopeptide repeat protein [Parvicella tangerina]|uniref:Tetratricopeptide repeat protein n=1 Tax=Parvicella tangerina TaxID=2829795 RepID=A0A916JMW8_9FLAO|nr:tetratricopeptide repeat protein [Parvicella tangerina]CAG5081814.1 hypothetical protein CRYO30217_01735 [Parvicella tangerina]